MELSEQKKQFVESTGMFFETQHLPRMAGRILGWLLISDSPAQPASAIAETLEMSKGSVSTMTRQLVQIGLIEKISQIGDRKDYYRIHPQATERLLLARQAEYAQLLELARQGLALMDGGNSLERQRLLAMKETTRIVIQGITALIERIQQTVPKINN